MSNREKEAFAQNVSHRTEPRSGTAMVETFAKKSAQPVRQRQAEKGGARARYPAGAGLRRLAPLSCAKRMPTAHCNAGAGHSKMSASSAPFEGVFLATGRVVANTVRPIDAVMMCRACALASKALASPDALLGCPAEPAQDAPSKTSRHKHATRASQADADWCVRTWRAPNGLMRALGSCIRGRTCGPLVLIHPGIVGSACSTYGWRGIASCSCNKRHITLPLPLLGKAVAKATVRGHL